MSEAASEALEQLVLAVRASPKYRTVCPALIRRIGQRELAARRTLKEAEQATRNKLHQVVGAYLGGRMRYGEWLETLTDAKSEGDAAFRAACRQVMRHHASTRERLSLLPAFYETIFAALPPVRSVLDVACGLNPLALSWMPLASDATYTACDIYEDMADFLNGFFPLAGVQGRAAACDVIGAPPVQAVDLALVLKVLPPLEQIDKTAGLALLKALNARFLLVSFPTQSLGGRGKQMLTHYEAHFHTMAQAERWATQRFVFSTELCFLVTR
jgi:16S rRNA (guanine(1405)-N(7))-methyltransferase